MLAKGLNPDNGGADMVALRHAERRAGLLGGVDHLAGVRAGGRAGGTDHGERDPAVSAQLATDEHR